MLQSSEKQLITGFDSNISDKCKIQKYSLELRRKLQANTIKLMKGKCLASKPRLMPDIHLSLHVQRLWVGFVRRM